MEFISAFSAGERTGKVNGRSDFAAAGVLLSPLALRALLKRKLAVKAWTEGRYLDEGFNAPSERFRQTKAIRSLSLGLLQAYCSGQKKNDRKQNGIVLIFHHIFYTVFFHEVFTSLSATYPPYK